MKIKHLYNSLISGDAEASKHVLEHRNLREPILEMGLGGEERQLLIMHGYKEKKKSIIWTELIRMPHGETSGMLLAQAKLINTDDIGHHASWLADLFLSMMEANFGTCVCDDPRFHTECVSQCKN